MRNRVTRDGDTVTVRDEDLDNYTLEILAPHPSRPEIFSIWSERVDPVTREMTNGVCISVSQQTLAALGDACHALAGEPDWRALAVKQAEAMREAQAIILEIGNCAHNGGDEWYVGRAGDAYDALRVEGAGDE